MNQDLWGRGRGSPQGMPMRAGADVSCCPDGDASPRAETASQVVLKAVPALARVSESCDSPGGIL